MSTSAAITSPVGSTGTGSSFGSSFASTTSSAAGSADSASCSSFESFVPSSVLTN